jgi:spore coat-associated protein N
MPVAARHPRAPRGLALTALMAVAAALVALVAATTTPDLGARLAASPNGNPLGISNSKNGVAILTATGMLPGTTRSGTVTLTNSGSVDADFTLDKARLVDTPGPHGGLLSRALDLRIEHVTGATSTTLYLGKLATMGQIRLGEFRKRTSRSYRFTVTLPDGGPPPSPTTGDNAYQGSSMRVDYVWTATKANGNGPKG